MPEFEALARKLKHYRLAKGISQEEFAWATGISREILSLIERQKDNPTLDTLQRIACYLGISVSELLSLEEPLCFTKYESTKSKMN